MTKDLKNIIWSDFGRVKLPKAYKLLCFDSDDLQILRATYAVMYPNYDAQLFDLGESYRRIGSVTIAGEKFGSKVECRTLRSARVMALWVDQGGHINTASQHVRPGHVKFYFVHTVKIENTYLQHLFACVQWCCKQEESRRPYKRPIEVWQHKKYEQPGPASFIPVQRIYCKFASASLKADGTQITVTSPILRTFC